MYKGFAAIDQSGIVPAHKDQIIQTAFQNNCIIMVRPVNRLSTSLIAEGYATKDLHVKGKSSNWGPQSGFICCDQKFSKLFQKDSHEIEKFKEFWSRQSVDDVLIRKLHTNSGSVPNEKSVKVNQISDEKNNRRPCLYPWERAVLTAKGSLNFCPTDWFGKSEVGDFSKMTIKDIWKNTFYKDLRNQHLNNNYKNEFCKQCPDWKNTSWPFDEKKSYADLVEKILYEEK